MNNLLHTSRKSWVTIFTSSFLDGETTFWALDCACVQHDGVLKLGVIGFLRPFVDTALYANVTSIVLITEFSAAPSARYVRLLEAAGVEHVAFRACAESRVGAQHTEPLVPFHQVEANEVERGIVRHVMLTRSARAVELDDAVVNLDAQVVAHAT